MSELNTNTLNDIIQVRTKICNVFLISLTAIAVPALFASLYRVTLIGWKPVMAFHIFIVILLVSCTLLRNKIAYPYKASLIILTFLLVGITGITQFGLIAGGVTCLVITAPVTALFFEKKLALGMLIIVLLTEAIIAYCFVNGYRSIDFDLLTYASSSQAWILGIFSLLLTSGSLTIATHAFNSKLLKSLDDSSRYQQNLLQHQLSLEKTIAEKTQELQQSNKDLEQFARIAAHDIRSPLNGINGYAQLLELDYQDKLDEDGKEYIQEIINSVRYASTMIDDLLGYSKINNEYNILSYVDLNDVLKKIQHNLSTEISENNTTITFNKLPIIYIIETQITRVFQNLLSNAIKYRSPDRHLTIHIAAEQNSNLWTFSVADNGIGIIKAQYDTIFELFHRIDDQANNESSGIGLAACKRIIEQHGGEIWVESEVNLGSCFHFTLPAQDLS